MNGAEPRLNILINAYAVSPTWGSEPGVGWNWIINIAKDCNVFVITESEWKDEITEAVARLPQKDHINFYFNPVPQSVRDMCWNQGDWRFYGYYREWQKRTLGIARQIISENHIDVIHQLNMIGFREPGYLWKIKDIPFVWGPIGNMAPVSLSYLKGSPLKNRVKQLIKNCISFYQARTGRVSKAARHSNQLITVLGSSAEIIESIYHKDALIMPETGLVVTPKVQHNIEPNCPIRLLWVGRFIPTKKLDIALRILANISKSACFELHIVGWGTDEEEERFKNMSKSLGVEHFCHWHGKIANSQVQDLMKTSDIFLFTSVLEGTPHVVLEAISNNLPVMCFDICGQGVIVNESVGWKITLDSINKAIQDMSDTLIGLSQNKEQILRKSENCEMRKPQLSWESKTKHFVEIYRRLAITVGRGN